LFDSVQSPSKDFMKVAGLVGLERFASFGAVPQANQAELIKAMLALVNQQTPPANRSPDAHDWLRESAGAVLANLGSTGPSNSVVKSFDAVISDAAAPAMLRCQFAQYLGQLKYPSAAKVDLTSLANSLGRMALDITKQELAGAKLANREPSRRIIVYAFYSALVGLVQNGKGGLVAPADGTPSEKQVAAVVSSVKLIHKRADDPDGDLTALATELNKLELVVGEAPKPQAMLAGPEKTDITTGQREDESRAAVDTATTPRK
jgi:hypothetical protein